MAERIHLEIVTPAGRALDTNAEEVTAPGENGEFGILPGHMPMLASLRTGMVTWKVGAETKKCAISGGFAEAGTDKLLILTEDFTVRENVNPVEVRKSMTEIDGQLSKVDPKESSAASLSRRKALAERHNWFAAQLELYGEPPPATIWIGDDAQVEASSEGDAQENGSG